MKPTIHIIFPTVRPLMMIETWRHWIRVASWEIEIRTNVIVNTEKQKEVIQENLSEMELSRFKFLVEPAKGPCKAVYNGCQKLLKCEPKDLIILVSDDMFCENNWDILVVNECRDSLLMNDGLNQGRIMTVPVMTYECYQKINGIISHPEYIAQYADNELYENLSQLNLIKDIRNHKQLHILHRHYTNGLRTKDSVDVYAAYTMRLDLDTFNRRMALPLSERLKVNV